MRDDSVSLPDTSEFEVETTGYFREKPDGALDPAGEAGWYLQRERERRGESLEEAGDMSGIHPYHIEAIEFGDMTRMPERLEALERYFRNGEAELDVVETYVSGDLVVLVAITVWPPLTTWLPRLVLGR